MTSITCVKPHLILGSLVFFLVHTTLRVWYYTSYFLTYYNSFFPFAFKVHVVLWEVLGNATWKLRDCCMYYGLLCKRKIAIVLNYAFSFGGYITWGQVRREHAPGVRSKAGENST